MDAERLHGAKEAELKRTAGRALPPRFTTSVAGVTFAPGYPQNLLALLGPLEDGPIVASLTREPDNEFDPCAVRVDVGGEPIGHLSRPLAARMAADLDADASSWTAVLSTVLINPGHPDRPGAEIQCVATQRSRNA